jgi:hypothetical protein
MFERDLGVMIAGLPEPFYDQLTNAGSISTRQNAQDQRQARRIRRPIAAELA